MMVQQLKTVLEDDPTTEDDLLSVLGAAAPAKKDTSVVDALTKQILGQGLTGKWSGQGHGSAEANATNMAQILSSAGITDIKQFGKVPAYTPVTELYKTYNGKQVIEQGNEDGTTVRYFTEPTGTSYSAYDSEGNEVLRPEFRQVNIPKDAKLETIYGVPNPEYQPFEGQPQWLSTHKESDVIKKDGQLVTKTGETFGNKVTGQAVPSNYDKAGGNIWSGTFAGKGSTSYGVQFGPDGTPIFYTQYGGSSNDLAKIMADIGPLGNIALAVATGGLTIPQQIAANLAFQVLSGKDIGEALKSAAISLAVAQIPGTDVMKEANKYIAGLDLPVTVTNTINSAVQNAVTSGARAALTGQNIGDAVLRGAATGGTNGAVGALLKEVDGFSDLTGTQKKMVINAVTGVISGKPLDQIAINAAIAAANAEIADQKKYAPLDKADEDDLTPGEKAAYDEGGTKALLELRRSLKNMSGLTTSGRTGDDTGGGDLTTTDTTLPIGVQVASTDNNAFKTDIGGTPTYAESANAASITPPFGYTLLSSSEADAKPEGSYYDITANAWFKPSTDTNVTDTVTVQADRDLFNTSIGDLDRLDTARTADDFAAFLKSIGITNTDELTDSGLSNQDILDLINATDDTVTVVGDPTTDTTTSTIGDKTDQTDKVDTVTVTGNKDEHGCDKATQYWDPVLESCQLKVADTTDTTNTPDTTETVTVTGCGPGKERNAAGECVPIDCGAGKYWDPITGQCEVSATTPTTITCPTGKVLNEAGTACIDEVIIKDKKCDPGFVYDEDLKMCVAEQQTLVCDAGFHEENGVCVKDKLVCDAGYHEENGVCVKDKITCPAGKVLNAEGTACIDEVKITACGPGKERNAAGECVPIDCGAGKHWDPITGQCELNAVIDECPTGYHRDDTGICVKDTLTCPPGKVLNEAGTACIDVVNVTACGPGKERNAEGKCVPIDCGPGKHWDPITNQCELDAVIDECPTGYHRDATGVCVKDTLTCPEGYEPNEAGTACIPVVVIKDKKCDPGFVYDEDLKMCVKIEDDCPTGYHRDATGACVLDDCPTGYERDEVTGKCIPVIEIKDKKCDPGFVYDENLKMCVPIKEEPCPTGYEKVNGTCVPVCKAGYHRDATGVCVPDDTDKCQTGYEKINGTCVPVCAAGYVRNLTTGVCEKVQEPCAKGYHRDETTGLCVPDDDGKCQTGYEKVNGTCVPVCAEGYIRNLATGVCEKAEEPCPKGYERDEETGACIPVLEIEACKDGKVRDPITGLCVLPPEDESCADGFHLENGLCVPDDDEKCQVGYEKVNGTCVPVCQEGYIRNLASGVCEKAEQACPTGQTKNAEGKCVPIVVTPTPCPAGQTRNAAGVCVPITTTTTTTTTPTPTGGALSQEKIDPIYAGAMGDFDLFATLEELLSNDSNKKSTQNKQQTTKMASGGYLDDLLAEQTTVDDLLKLLR